MVLREWEEADPVKVSKGFLEELAIELGLEQNVAVHQASGVEGERGIVLYRAGNRVGQDPRLNRGMGFQGNGRPVWGKRMVGDEAGGKPRLVL